MKWFSRKPFAALLVSMALVAFLPLLLNNLFYIRFRNTVLEQQKSLTGASLKFSVQQIDRTLLELTTLGMELSDELKNISVPPAKEMDASSRMKLYNVAKSLQKEMQTGSEYIGTLYLYSAGSQRAVGNQGVYEESMIHQKFYKDWKVPEETMRSLHQTFSYGQLVPLGSNNMAFIRTVSRGNGGLPDKQLVVLLKNSFYKMLIEKGNVADGIFLLMDGDSILAVSNKTGLELNEEELARIPEYTGNGDVALGKKTVMLYTLESAIGGYRVKAAVPYDQLLDKSSEMQTYYWLVLAASILLGGGLAVYLSRRNVMPLNQLIGYIRKNYGADSPDTQGLEEIKGTVDALLDQRRTAREQLKQYETVIARNRLVEMLRGNRQEGNEFFLPTGCRYVAVCFSSADQSPEKENEFIISAQQALPSGCFCRSVVLDGRVIQVLGRADPEFDEHSAEELLTAQIDWMDQRGTLTVSAAFSTVYESPEELERAYGEACMAMLFSSYKADSVITSFSSCEFKAEYFLRDWHHLDKQLLFSRLIWEGKFDEASQLLSSLFPSEFLEEYFPESDISNLHLASLKYQFLHDVDSISEVVKMEPEVRNHLLQELIYCKTHRRLYQMTQQLFSELTADSVQARTDDSEVDRISEIKQYICQNCSNPQMNVASVADAFGMSANNLSQLFSRKADGGVLDYIHEIRMKNAGELLLKCQNMTIQEVAVKVGYTSILTFNRKFKACYQQTPGEYRKEQMKRDGG